MKGARPTRVGPRLKQTILVVARQHTHAMTVAIALCTIGLILVYNGSVDLPDIHWHEQRWVVLTSLVGSAIAFTLAALIASRRIVSTTALDASMTTALVAASIANTATGAVWQESLWIVCAYSMVITISAGITLRSFYTFVGFMVFQVLSWVFEVSLLNSTMPFESDATILVLVSTFVATGTAVALRLERETQNRLMLELKTKADRDPLTGALNRTGLKSELVELERVSGGEGPLWCSYLDVNYFKSINDHRGHDYGDEALREIALGLNETVGPNGLVARWGGDEFVVIDTGPSLSEADIEAGVDRRLAGLGIDASVSAGISADRWEYRPDPESLIERADQRMYRRRDASRAPVQGPPSIADPVPPFD